MCELCACEMYVRNSLVSNGCLLPFEMIHNIATQAHTNKRNHTLSLQDAADVLEDILGSDTLDLLAQLDREEQELKSEEAEMQTLGLGLAAERDSVSQGSRSTVSVPMSGDRKTVDAGREF